VSARRLRLERADADSSGDVTVEEFVAAMNCPLAKADADKDGRITVAGLADRIERTRIERMARGIIAGFDVDGEGTLTADEIQARQQRLFALLDRNTDGKFVPGEMPPRDGPRR